MAELSGMDFAASFDVRASEATTEPSEQSAISPTEDAVRTFDSIFSAPSFSEEDLQALNTAMIEAESDPAGASSYHLVNLLKADQESVAVMMMIDLLPSVDDKFDPDGDVGTIAFSNQYGGLNSLYRESYKYAQTIDNGLKDDGLSKKA